MKQDLLDYLHMYDLPEYVQHWTPKGTFSIQAAMLAGSPAFELGHGGYVADTFLTPDQASQALAAGDVDEELEFSTAGLSIPADWRKWNGFD